MGKRLGALALLCLTPLAGAADWHYQVRPGDSLWTLCQRFTAQPRQCRDHLADHNRLNRPDRVTPGQVLRFPRGWLKTTPRSARLIAETGDVMRYPAAGGPAQPVSPGQAVAVGDAIETGEGSARLRFPDQSRVRIMPRSLLIVQGYSRRLGRPGNTALRVPHGGLQVRRPESAAKNSRFRVYTPGGTVTVRGIEYDLLVDGRESTRDEVLAGALVVTAGGQRTTVRGGQGIRVAPGQAAPAPVSLLPAPALSVHATRHRVTVAWPALQQARGYWLEVYALPQDTLLGEHRVAGHRWHGRLPSGEYRVRVRAVDDFGLRGRMARAEVRLPPPSTHRPPAAPAVAAPSGAPLRPDSDNSRDLWIFLGAAALMTML